MKTDAQPSSDIAAELDAEPTLEAVQIGVQIQDGIVTLAGHVKGHTERWARDACGTTRTGCKGSGDRIGRTSGRSKQEK